MYIGAVTGLTWSAGACNRSSSRSSALSKRRGPPEQPGARRVGEILALPRDPKLKQRRAKRREQHRHQRAEHTEGVVFLVRA